MKDFGTILFIVAAGFVVWLAVTGRLKNAGAAWSQLVGPAIGGTPSSTSSTNALNIQRLLVG